MSGVSLTSEFAALDAAFDLGLGEMEWLTINALKSAFAPFDERLRLINEVVKPGYAHLRAEALRGRHSRLTRPAVAALGRRQRDHEARAAVPVALDPDAAAHGLHQPAGGEQPDPGAARAGLVDPDVGLEHRLPVVERHARPVVGDVDPDLVVLAPRARDTACSGGAYLASLSSRCSSTWRKRASSPRATSAPCGGSQRTGRVRSRSASVPDGDA